MSNFEAVCVEDALKNAYGNGGYDHFWSDLSWTSHGTKLDLPLSIHGGTYDVEVVDTKPGSEGDWQTDVYVVLKVDYRYFRKNGYYASHDGTYWDGIFEEVKPHEKSVTVWDSL